MATGATEAALLDGLARALGLPRPFPHEENRAFRTLESWPQLTAALAAQPVAIRPLGYYRTPDSVDIYVFEVTMGKADEDKKSWKIYRRYRHFHKYVGSSSELLASMVVPRLSQAYLKLFNAQTCKDRLEELHAWLEGVVENTQAFCRQQAAQGKAADTSRFYRLRMDSIEARPLLLLSCFLLSGANSPLPHYFRGLPPFAVAREEINVQLERPVTALYPSRVRSSLPTHAGLGLRLTPSHEQDGKFLGATVSGFLRDVGDVDKALAAVPVGSRLARVNGIDVLDAPFDQVLGHIRAAGFPLRLRFIYAPPAPHRGGGSSVDASVAMTRGSFVEADLAAHRRVSNASVSSSDTARTGSALEGSGSDATAVSVKSSADVRSYSVDARRASNASIFGSVIADLFGRKRVDSADQALDRSHQQQRTDEALASWDDIGGEFFDILSRGFYTSLPLSRLHEFRRRRAKLLDDELDSSLTATTKSEDEWKALEQRKGQGVWTASSGAIGLCMGACKLRDMEAAMLEVPPAFFSSRGIVGSEKRLAKGFVVVSINHESTFGLSFAKVMKKLTTAPRPTSVSFRWFRDYSPFLETELAEQSDSKLSSYDASRTFEFPLDCVAEAQVDLCDHLHLALVENASVRDELAASQAVIRETRVELETTETARSAIEAKLRDAEAANAKLRDELDAKQQEVVASKTLAREAEAKAVDAKREYHRLALEAQTNALEKIAEQEARLVKESNKSIETARAVAERKTQQLLDATASEMQRKHDEYLQKLAEEHSEEVEGLMQQVAVWRHQVEVLTEAEKRNYAALVHNGINPYQDVHRSRFGVEDPAYRSSRSSGSSLRNSLVGPPPPARAAGEDRSTLIVGGGGGDRKNSTLGGVSELSSPADAANGTFWDRMVSLLATE